MKQAMKVAVSDKMKQMCANKEYMDTVNKAMYEYNHLSRTSERTWYPEMEDVRARI